MMESLQALSCSVICLHPEVTLNDALNYLNVQCLEQVVNCLSMNDLLKYQQELKKKGIDTDAAIHSCQWKLLMPILDSHMASTICPHLHDLCPRNGCNWGLSRSLSGIIMQNVVEYFHDCPPDKHNIFDKSTQKSVLESHDCIMRLFCPPACSSKHLELRKNNLPGDALWCLLMLAAENIFSMSVDLKFCKLLMHPQLKPVLDTFLDSLQILSLLLKSSRLVLNTIKTFKDKAKNLKHVCLYVIRDNDLLYFDEILSVCSGVLGFHKTPEGTKDKIALHSMLSSLDESSNQEQVPIKCQFKISVGNSNLQDWAQDSKTTSDISLGEECAVKHNSGDSKAQMRSSNEFDLMDDAVLFGTASPASSLDSTEGFSKVDIKITNLVQTNFWAPLLNHHLTHWLALTNLHLGVPILEPLTVQGIVCLLKRVQFTSFALYSATVSRKEIEEILSAVALHRVSHPLHRLMFVSVAITIGDLCFESHLNEILGSDERTLSKDTLANQFPRLSQSGFYQGTELLEIYSCGFDLWTENLFLQFLSQNLALKTLCLGNNIMPKLGKTALHNLTVNDVGQRLHSLILEDWPVNSSNCFILKDLLIKMAPTLTSLSLKGCLIDRNHSVFSDIVLGVSACTGLQNLDLSGNSLGKYGACFFGMFIRLIQLKELSLKGNRLPENIVRSIFTELAESSKYRQSRMKVLDMRGNVVVRNGDGSQQSIIKVLQRSFVNKIMLDKEDS